MAKRVITAIILIPAVIFIVHVCSYGTALLLLVFSFIALSEYYRIADSCNLKHLRFSGYLASAMIITGFLLKAAFNYNLQVHFFTLGIMAVFFEELIRGRVGDAVISVSTTIAGVVYTAFLPGCLILLRGDSAQGESLVYMLFLATWASDIFAYFTGTAFGKHKLIPGISPNKSWEGLAAALAAGAFACAGYKWISASPLFLRLGLGMGDLTYGHCILTGLLLGMTGQAGDLMESMLKRNAGVKDSGDLFPGHGGVLDRCDSLILNIPVFYLIISIIMRGRA